MESIYCTEAIIDFGKLMDKVGESNTPIAITRKNKGSVVLISMRDYQALKETNYLLNGRKNAQRLLESIAEVETKR